MKQNAMRRDPATKADGWTDRDALRAERDAEGERDLRLGRPERAAPDERTNAGRREAQMAGGNGEQRSRERARLRSEEDPTGKQPPFRKHDAPMRTSPKHVGPEQAITADERTMLPHDPLPERTSAPANDFE
jgi:hypothetical protein